MTDFVEWIPKHHGQKPDYWTPDTLTGLDNKNYVRQLNWAWIAGTTYYVPYEAVHGMSRDVDELLTDGAGTLDDYQRGALDERTKIAAWLREPTEAWVTTVAKEIAASDGVPEHAPPGHYLRNAKVAFKAIADAFEKERSDGQ